LAWKFGSVMKIQDWYCQGFEGVLD